MTRTHHTRTLLLALVVLTAFTVAPAAVAAQDGSPPGPPASYYGDVTIDGDPAPAGVEIVAYVDGEERGSFLTDDPGEYGSPSAFDENLVVQGDEDDEGELVEFTVNGQPADETVEWESGAVENVDLSASLSDDPGDGSGDDPGDGGEDPGNGDDGASGGGGAPSGGGGGAPSGGGGAPSGSDSTQDRVDAETVDAEDNWAVSVSADSVAAGATVDADLDGAITADGTSMDGVSVAVDSEVDEFGLSVRSLEADALPDGVDELDAASALTYTEFKPDGFESESVTESTFSFTVDETSLSDDTDPEHVSLYRFDGGWEQVPTAYQGDGEYTATAEGFSVFAVGASESGVAVTSATLEETTIDAGDLAVVSATIENTGDVEGTTSVTLQVDGEVVDDRRVTVDPDETRDVTFTPSFDDGGDYAIAIDDVDAGTLAVEGADASTDDGVGSSDDDAGSGDDDGESADDGADESDSGDADETTTEAFGVTPIALVGVLALVLVVVGTLALRRR